MSDNYLTFKRFNNPTLATDFIEFLKSEDISYLIEDASPSFDVTFANNSQDKEIHIKIKQSDFGKVEELLIKKESAISIDDIPNDYYLLKFSNEELIEILSKPDEWSPIDYNLSQKVLESRGKSIDPEFLNALRKNRIKELSAPEDSPKNWIYAGYIFALLGGLLGIFIGWHLLTFKRTLLTGKRTYGYTKSNRKDGRNILIIGIIFFIIHVTIGLYYDSFYSS